MNTDKNEITEKKENAGYDESNDKRKKNRRADERRSTQRRKEYRREIDKKESTLKESTIMTQLKSEITGKDDEIDNLKKEIESIKELIQRRQADFENFKKRNLKQLEDYKKFAIKEFALSIIEMNDDIHRAIESSSNIPEGESVEKAYASFVEGVSIISKQIESALNKSGIVEIDSLNQKFDPNFHEAVEIEEVDGITTDTVTKVHQKGFRIDDIVVRSSKVKVSKPIKGDDAKTVKEPASDDSDISDSTINDDNRTNVT